MRRHIPCNGSSLLEIVFTMGLVATVAGLSVPAITNGLEATRTLSAARHTAFRLRLSRAAAASRARAIGWRFERVDDEYRMTPYVDGDGDGIRTSDIQAGVDTAFGPSEQVSDRFPGVRFGIMSGVRAIDGGAPIAGDPLQIGRTDILTFTPQGTASSGTVYLRGRRTHQYAVRVLGVTGRVRVLEYSFADATWRER